MKNQFFILMLFLSTFSSAQTFFEFDRVMENYVDFNVQGHIIFNIDMSSIDIMLDGEIETKKIKKLYSEYGNPHIKADIFYLNEKEKLFVYYHDYRIYAVGVKKNSETYCSKIYIKTKW